MIHMTTIPDTLPVPTILVVDDEARSRKLLTTRLENEGYAVSTATDGKQAKSLMKIEQFDLVLLDLNMPEMNGFELLEWLQERPQHKRCVIVLTANGDRDAVTTCLTLGADDYVLKTAATIELMRRVERACNTVRTELRHQQTIAEGHWHHSRVLLVDDDALNRKLLRRRLEHLGLEVHELDNGQAVVDALQQTAFDLVLLDHHMPRLTGLEVLERIREQQNSNQLGVVMVTAETEPAQIEQFYRSGADDYLAKPFHGAELQMRLQAVLKNLFLQRQTSRF